MQFPRIPVSAQLLPTVIVLFCCADTSSGQSPAELPLRHRALFERHCFACHDAETHEGSINLENLPFDIAKDIQTAEQWQKILGVINAGEMPPEENPPLADQDKADLLNDLSNRMVDARKILSDTGGIITMRRLNRREYANTIDDLLGIRPDVSTLPDDQATAGFDTAGASLYFSSDQLEQYLATARRSLELALAPETRRESRTIRIEPEDEYTPHYAAAADEMRDSARRANAFLSQSEKPASEFGILDAYSARKKRVAEWLPQLEQYLARPETKTGATLIMTIKQGGYTKVKLPVLHEQEDGRYTIRVRAAAYAEADERLHYLEFSAGYGTGRTLLGWRKITGTLDDPQVIEFPIVHQRGEKQQIWIHQRSHQDRGDKNLATIDMRRNGIGTPPGIWIDWAEFTGPERVDRPPTPLAACFADLASEPVEDDVRSLLHNFAVRAFRNSEPDAAYLDRLVRHYIAGRDKGQPHSAAIVDPLAIILASPGFLYLVEPQDPPRTTTVTGTRHNPQVVTGNTPADGSPTEGRHALTSNELAVRLSYFLWSAPPDDELLELASRDALTDPAVLREQTKRMLADPRADQFVRGFVHQWLQLERIDMFQFDGVQFPTFDNAVRANAREEIFQTVNYLLQAKLPLDKLLKADFVVVNDLMAGYYDIPFPEPAQRVAGSDDASQFPSVGAGGSVPGHEFRRVDVPPDSIRGGLLGTAAIHAMGSDGMRSSPVERGAWVLRHLLHDPPPPAPPNVPQLSRLAGEILSARELAKAHQEQPQCNQCHQKIDPIGFGLENFDAAGLWRDKETIGTGKRRFGEWQDQQSFPIDPGGKLPNGNEFADYFGLRDEMAGYRDEFARGFTEALIEYGLGRPYGFTDHELAEEMLRHAKRSDYELNSFIHALAQSTAFRSK